MRHTFLLIGTAFLLAGAARGLAAQQVAQSGATHTSARTDTAVRLAPPACTSYVVCALRVEPKFIGGPRLVRGAHGSMAASLGALRPSELAQLFAGNDSASAYALGHVRAERVNRLLTYSGIVLGAVGLAQPRRTNGLTVSGASMLIVSLPYQLAAERYLSRAVWWYNAALTTRPPDHE